MWFVKIWWLHFFFQRDLFHMVGNWWRRPGQHLSCFQRVFNQVSFWEDADYLRQKLRTTEKQFHFRICSVTLSRVTGWETAREKVTERVWVGPRTPVNHDKDVGRHPPWWKWWCVSQNLLSLKVLALNIVECLNPTTSSMCQRSDYFLRLPPWATTHLSWGSCQSGVNI